MAGDSSHDRSAGNWAIDCAIAAIAILPLLLTRHLPLSDLPNHMARQYILRDLAGSPALQTFYEVHWALVPNLALDIFVLGARTLMSIDLAVRLFCIAAILLIFFGARLINRTLGGERATAYRVTPLLCYGGSFQLGLLNFCFGIGLALVLFGFFLRLRKGSTLRLVLVFAPFSFALLLCHLAAFGLFAIALGSFELAQAYADAGALSRRFLVDSVTRQARLAAFLVPSFLLYKLFSVPSVLVGLRYSTLWEKAEGIAGLTMFSSPATELPLLAAAMVGLLGALATRMVRLHRCFFIMAGLFALVWLALPRNAVGGGYVDYRVLWGESFFLVAGLIPGAGVRFGKAFGVLFGALVLIRIGLIAMFWLSWEPAEAAIDGALGRLPLGARLLPVIGDPHSTSLSRRPPLDHVAGYAVSRRQAFEANIFASISGQILYLRPPYGDIWMLNPPSELKHMAGEYNYVLVLRPQFARISPELPLTCVEEGPLFRLLKVTAADHPLTAKERQGRCAN